MYAAWSHHQTTAKLHKQFLNYSYSSIVKRNTRGTWRPLSRGLCEIVGRVSRTLTKECIYCIYKNIKPTFPHPAALHRRGQGAEAIAIYSRLCGWGLVSPEILCNNAHALIQASRQEQAAALLDEVTPKVWDSSDALTMNMRKHCNKNSDSQSQVGWAQRNPAKEPRSRISTVSV